MTRVRIAPRNRLHCLLPLLSPAVLDVTGRARLEHHPPPLASPCPAPSSSHGRLLCLVPPPSLPGRGDNHGGRRGLRRWRRERERGRGREMIQMVEKGIWSICGVFKFVSMPHCHHYLAICWAAFFHFCIHGVWWEGPVGVALSFWFLIATTVPPL